MNWKYVQRNADKFLASGLKQLSSGESVPINSKFNTETGNYIISHGKISYIGEAQDLNRRLKQHSKERTSTFFKNYLKKCKEGYQIKKGLSIEQFGAKTISISFGRKELEEFGIVNLPAILNRFQLGKRDQFKDEISTTLWNRLQAEASELLEAGEKEFRIVKFNDWFDSNPKPKPGLYWVETHKHGLIYIGESSDIRERWQTHSSKTYFSALRRHIGENILGFELGEVSGRKRSFQDNEDMEVTNFIRRAKVKFFPVDLGRYELEESLIRKHRPLLNRKDNK